MSFEPDRLAPLPQLVAAANFKLERRPAHPANYSHARRTPTLIVVHCTDGHEGPTKDRDVAAMFARSDLEKRRSAHYVVDSDSVTACVPDELTAWHCSKTGNARGIGVELCGRADQSYEQWHDPVSLATLQLAARLIADLCIKHLIPPVYLMSTDLRAGRSGITTHASVAIAWGESQHTDPGKDFPMVKLVTAVKLATEPILDRT